MYVHIINIYIFSILYFLLFKTKNIKQYIYTSFVKSLIEALHAKCYTKFVSNYVYLSQMNKFKTNLNLISLVEYPFSSGFSRKKITTC